MFDIIAVMLVSVVGLLLAVWAQQDLSWREARWLWWSVVAHYISYLILTGNQVRGGVGDMLRYVYFGQLLADDLRRDFWGVLPHTVTAFFHLQSNLNVNLPGVGSTVSVAVLTAWVCLFVGNSLWAANAVFMFGSILGKIAFYRGLKAGFPPALWDRVGWAVFLVPSFVLWTSGIVKEGVAMIGVGMIVLALSRLVAHGTFVELFRAAFGIVLVGLVKPYVLFVLAGAILVWFYYQWATSDGRIVELQPVQLAVIAGVGILAILLLGYVFPQFAIERIAEEAVHRQNYAYRTQAKSAYFIGDPSQLSLLGQAAFAPLGMITAWYRPFFFEAGNAMAMISSIEGTIFLGGTILVFVRGEPRLLWRAMSRWPWVPAGLAFSIVFGAIVGLVTSNFGTMVRYRAPLMPFLALALLILSMRRAELRSMLDVFERDE